MFNQGQRFYDFAKKTEIEISPVIISMFPGARNPSKPNFYIVIYMHFKIRWEKDDKTISFQSEK